ncbi:ABC transporter substrate-binding protein [Bosea sp. LjRoot9]|uniref:ABC transporter substrate-binding protein n=1 Tax=Bosea sp. LjRoot9 TaxID=3342341 RepID=UPI003ECED295
MSSTFNSGGSRRTVIKGVASGLVGLALPAVWSPSRAQNKRIVVRDDGGIYTRAYQAAFYRPFTQATGIEVVAVQANAEPVAQIKGIVDSKANTWDMAKISSPAILLLTTGNKVYLEKHGLEAEPVVQSIPDHFKSAYGVGTNVYTSVLAYRTDAFKGRKAPRSWVDFWNIKDFPGRRGMLKFPYNSIEEALMADGVPTDKVYPCDLDRAFKSLDKIKSDVQVWWSNGAQVEQLLTTGEVDLVATFVSRPQAAQANGAPVEIVWDQGIWGLDSWAILAGTPNGNACREFIKFASDPKRMAALTEFFPAGVTQPAAFDGIKPDLARNCPTYPDNIKNSLKIDAQYWYDNQTAVIERFNAWILK